MKKLFPILALLAGNLFADLARLEAEDYTAMSGVRTQATDDIDGVENVGWIDNGDWLEYQIDIPSPGTYRFNFRIASDNADGGEIEVASGAETLALVTVPFTNGWQNWETISHIIDFPTSGIQTIRLNLLGGEGSIFNINWLSFDYGPIHVEAEDFSAMSGVEVEPDKGAGTDSIGYIHNGDWADYQVFVPEPGTYRFTFSAASKTDGGTVEITSNGTTLGTAEIPNTSAWDNWQPFSGEATFTTAGLRTLRLNFVSATNTAALFNLDWFSLEIPKGIPIVIGTTPKQTMRYGMDYERLWYWTGGLNSSERDLVAKWSVVDNDIDFIRVAINSGYELTEGDYDLSAYTSKIIPMMQEMQEANPEIKFFASPRPLDEAQSGARWQPYPKWITGDNGSSFNFNWQNCAEYLERYILLMKSYGFKISYMDITNEWQDPGGNGRINSGDVRDIVEYLKDNLDPADMPLIIAPSSWNFVQGEAFINSLNTTRRRNAVDIAASHNTDKTGTAQSFADTVKNVLGPDTEIWNTEVHGWKSTSNANEVLTFSFMLEAINAGFSGLSGWLAIGTTNQGHSYILNPSGSPSRNVKYFIFNKLTNTSHRGQALDIETPGELSHTTALIKGDLLTVWAINQSTETVDIQLNLNGRTATNQSVIRTRWNTGIDVEGEVTTRVTSDPTSVFGSIPAESLCCFEILLDPAGGPVTRLEAEAYDAQSGTTTEATGDADGNLNVARIGHGDWLRFDNLTLAENASARFRIARPTNRPSPVIEVRLDSPTGPLVGSVSIPETGAWQNWKTVSTDLTNSAGTYNVYLVFRATDTVDNTDMVNLNWFALSMTEPLVDPISPENLIVSDITLSNTDQILGTFAFSIQQSGQGQLYQLQFSNTLAANSWTDAGEPVVGNGGLLEFETFFPTALAKRFYRVKVSIP